MRIRRPDQDGVSPVIAVILMVAITVVLVSILYVLVNGFTQQLDHTPRGALIFEEHGTIIGRYTGGFQGSVSYEDIEIKLIDRSNSTGVTFEPYQETFKQVPGGLSITISDVNSNGILDGSDVMVIQNGAMGDEITIIYKLNSEIVGLATLT
jgi:flagellin-like protein